MKSYSLKAKTFLVIGFAVLAGAILARPALAEGPVLPNPAPMPNGLVVVSKTGRSTAGGTFALGAEEAVYNGYSTTSSTTLTFRDFCSSATGWGDWRSLVDIYRNNSSEARVTPYVQRIRTDSCGASPHMTYNLSGLTRSTVQGHEQFYTFTIIARYQHTTGAGINGFRVEMSGGGANTISFADDPQRATSSRPGPWPFSVLNRQFSSNPRGESSYRFRFAADCTVTAPRQIFLKWSDADYGRTNEQGGVISFTLRNDTTGANVMTLSGSQLMAPGQVGVNDSYHSTPFTINPGHRYTWTWNNVDNNNGVQLWMPYSEVNYFQDCGQFDYRASIGLNRTTARPGDTIRATHTNRNVGNAAGPAWLRAIHVPSGGAYVTRATSWGNDSGDMARQYGVAGIGAGVSRSRAANYTVGTNAPHGSQVCFYARVATSSPATTHSSGQRCVTIQNPLWNYTINRSGPADTATFPKPGNNITITSRVANNGEGAGAAYEHRFQVTEGAGLLVNASVVRHTGLPGLGAGSGRNRTATFRIAPDASHGGRVCFIARVAPYQGRTYPSPPTATSSGWRNSQEICYTIYNLRFDLHDDPNIGFNLSNGSGPGQDVPTTYSINNGDSDDLNEQFPNASPGPSSSLNVRAQITTGNASLVPSGMSSQNTPPISWGGSFQRSFNIRIDTDAAVGDDVCLRVFVNWEQGYSDGTDLANNPQVDTDPPLCFNVSDGPYLQALGHDTWAGGGYQIGGSCSVGSGNVDSHARPRVQSNGTPISGPGVGAMDQYALFAGGSVSGFGSQNNPLANDLTFANTPSLGNFGADNRCLANLFDSGGNGGNINDALWDNATDQNNLNSLNQNDNGQFRISGSTTYNSGGAPFNNFRGNATILINGNLEIRRNIIINTNNIRPGDTPFLVFVVAGDIRIQNNVDRLDGIYISYGQIDTCNTFGGGSLSPVTSLTADGDCRDHLEVNGSLIANDIAFRRTYGGTNEAATGNVNDRCDIPSGLTFDYSSGGDNTRCSAETIIFPTWFWLANPHFNLGGGPEANQYRIQQIRDLPPIF